MGTRVIWGVKRLFSEGMELPGHRLAFVSETLGYVDLGDGFISVRKKHQRPVPCAKLLDLKGVPIEGFTMYNASVSKMSVGGAMLIDGVEIADTLIVKHFAQRWWCEPVEIQGIRD